MADSILSVYAYTVGGASTSTSKSKYTITDTMAFQTGHHISYVTTWTDNSYVSSMGTASSKVTNATSTNFSKDFAVTASTLGTNVTYFNATAYAVPTFLYNSTYYTGPSAYAQVSIIQNANPTAAISAATIWVGDTSTVTYSFSNHTPHDTSTSYICSVASGTSTAKTAITYTGGTFTGMQAGTATMTVRANDPIHAQSAKTVTVKQQISTITGTQSATSVNKGGTVKITAITATGTDGYGTTTVTPSDRTCNVTVSNATGDKTSVTADGGTSATVTASNVTANGSITIASVPGTSSKTGVTAVSTVFSWTIATISVSARTTANTGDVIVFTISGGVSGSTGTASITAGTGTIVSGASISDLSSATVVVNATAAGTLTLTVTPATGTGSAVTCSVTVSDATLTLSTK